MLDQSQQSGQPIQAVPKRGKSRDGLIQLGLVYVHQHNLAKVIAGDMMDDLDGAALYDAVVRRKRPLSLRPLSMEGLWFLSFVPIVQRLADETWLIGRPDQGKHQLVKKPRAEIIPFAQSIYVKWVQEDDEKWQGWLAQASKSVRPFYHQVMWQVALAINPDEPADLGGDYALHRLGKHSTYHLFTPEGSWNFESYSPAKAVEMALAVMKKQGHQPLPHDDSQPLQRGLIGLGSSLPQAQREDGWLIGFVQAKKLPQGLIRLRFQDQRTNKERHFGLSSQKGVFTLQELSQNKTIKGQILMPSQWDNHERLQSALMWAAWLAAK